MTNSNYSKQLTIALVLISNLYVCMCAFKHPGILVSKAQLDYVKTKQSAGVWKTAFDAMMKSKYASLSYEAKTHKVVECGSYSKPNFGCTDERESALSAYTHALIWYYTGEKKHAEKAIELMDAWSKVITGHNNTNARLQAGWSGCGWPQAAEIIKHSNAGWDEANVKRFEEMLRKVYLPILEPGDPNQNGNWELIMIEAMGGIAVFLDDKTVFDKAVDMWRKRVPAYMYLKSDGALPHPPPKGTKNSKDAIIKYWFNQTTFVDGLAQETCRDYGHTQMGIAAAINFAETAYHQGVDLYKEEHERIVKAMEFHATYINGAADPSWLCHGKMDIRDHIHADQVPTSGPYPMWEVAYNHYNGMNKIDMPHSHELITKKLRPAGCDDHMVAWQTLTHADNPNY